jgi:hypothetical protein
MSQSNVMINRSTSSTADDALTRRCAVCAYDLRGLPASGTCPECGSRYDSQTLVLLGWPGRTRNPVACNPDHARRGLVFWSIMGICICGALFMNERTDEEARIMMLIFAPILAAYASLAALPPDHPGPAQAQLSPNGLGQRDYVGRVRQVRWSPRHRVRVERTSRDQLRLAVQNVWVGIACSTPVDIVIRTSDDPQQLMCRCAEIRNPKHEIRNNFE